MLNLIKADVKSILGVIFLLIPFSYYSLFGFRVVIFGSILILISISVKGISIKKNVDLTLFLINVLIVFFLSAYSNNYNEFLAAFVFFIFMYWPYLMKDLVVTNELVSRYIKLYLFSAVFCALGVIFQSFLYIKFGIEFGKIDTYLNRTGFGFLWLDYSFLSLFLSSSIPLFFRENIRGKYILSLIVIVGSITTTARTGLFSLVVAMFLISFIGFNYNLLRSKVRKIDLAVVASSFFLVATISSLWSHYSDRELTFNGSGRFDGYYNAFLIFLDSPYFGYAYNVEEYRALYGAVPHNIILYIMVFGGLFGLAFFLSWVIFLFLRISKADFYFKLSFMTVFLGLQFIPSYYSGYFIAILISIYTLSESTKYEKTH
nr:O-antigen ligase family protein [Vibrio cyclitrophicus]PMF25656.1 hypothetical protein BCV17_02615 [Vibrio cyclitrophicus]